MPKFGHFGPKSINLLILTKFRQYHFSKVLISNLTLVFENFDANHQIWVFWVKMYNFLENFPVPYFEGADFKADIHFLKFLAA